MNHLGLPFVGSGVEEKENERELLKHTRYLEFTQCGS